MERVPPGEWLIVSDPTHPEANSSIFRRTVGNKSMFYFQVPEGIRSGYGNFYHPFMQAE